MQPTRVLPAVSVLSLVGVESSSISATRGRRWALTPRGHKPQTSMGSLMDALGLKRASLVGISMGAGAALGFALRSPERIEKLVLVDSYGLGSQVPWGRLGYLLVRAPFLKELTYALLRRSRTMIRWSLYGLVYANDSWHPEVTVHRRCVGSTGELL